MKIAFVAQPFDVIPSDGSMAIWINEISKRIVSEYEIVVFSKKRKFFDNSSKQNGIKHVRTSTLIDDQIVIIPRIQTALFKLFNIKIDFLRKLFFKFYYFRSYYYFFYITAISLKIKREKPDIVVFFNFSQFVPIVKFFNQKIKTVLIMQCDWLIELESTEVNRRLKNTDAILGCSNYIVQGIQRKFPQYQTNCYTLYNGSSQALFNPNKNSTIALAQEEYKKLGLEDKKVILFVGRITPEKGVDVLIKAMKLVLKLEQNCILLIIGSLGLNPPSPIWLNNNCDSKLDQFEYLKSNYKIYENYLKNLSFGLEDKIKFLGSKSHYEELATYYSLCDIFVHPSVWNEPFGMILTEAMYCECPVISTCTGGIPEIVVNGETGLLVKPNDPQGLADAILQLIKNETLRKEMGRKAKERVKNKFSWENTSQAFLNILNEIQK
jgi:glycosyltransferase involved in cell wall biosynthesis